jgi:hypothetical protein
VCDLAKKAMVMLPGFHFRIPFVDVIYLVNTRLRVDGSKTNQTRYISATVGYYVSNPLKAMLKFGLPYAVVVSRAQGEIAAVCDEAKVLEGLRSFFDADSGISIDFVKFVEDVEVRTYRLINAIAYPTSGHESVAGPNGTTSARY